MIEIVIEILCFRSVNVVMETKGGKKKSSSSSGSKQYEAPLGYIIEDVRPNGGIEKFRSAAYSNVRTILLNSNTNHKKKTFFLIDFCNLFYVWIFFILAVREEAILIFNSTNAFFASIGFHFPSPVCFFSF
jgi:hypothetical protein